MKKVTFLFALMSALVITSANAQTSQGNMMVGGTLSFSNTSQEGSSDAGSSSTTFSPSFGYFVIDNLAVGANIGFTSGTTDTGATKTEANTFSFGPFARYYKFTSNDKFAFFGQASLTLSSTKTETTPPGNEVKNGSTTFAISPGFAYFFNEHWALDFSITGLSIRSNDPNKDADDDKTTTIQFNISSLSPQLGFRYHFGN